MQHDTGSRKNKTNITRIVYGRCDTCGVRLMMVDDTLDTISINNRDNVIRSQSVMNSILAF